MPPGVVASSFSSIRTVTVGSGITPDLLTLKPKGLQALAGLPSQEGSPPVRNSTLP
jgi:hypothetical protein